MITKAELDRITGLLRAGQNKTALKLCKVGMKRQPKEPAFAHLAGTALSSAGNPREGAQYFMKALKLAPGNVASQDNLVSALVHSQQFDKARSLVRKLLKERGTDAHLLYQLASLEFQSSNPEPVQKALDACIKVLTGNPAPANRNLLMRAHSLRGRHHQLIWDNKAAKQDFEAAYKLAPNDLKNAADLASCYAVELNYDQAIELLEGALQSDPNNKDVLLQYAAQLSQVARRDEAIEAYQKIVRNDPLNADALLQLVNTASADDAIAREAQLKTAFRDAAKASYDQGKIAFAMAKNSERKGDRTLANQWYATANKIVAGLRHHNAEQFENNFSSTTALFPPDHQLTAKSVSEGPVPVFVIGQPRSGTTLTEMVLSSHPTVAGVGEQTTAGTIARSYMRNEIVYDAAEAEKFALGYRAELPDLPDGATHFVDKMPGNYQYVGFILTAFPNAVILNIARDPRDVAWSMWRVHFPALGLNYTFDMASMADEANRYRRYIEFWKSVFPGQIHNVHYEELVADIEGQSKRMAELCGVEWVPEMAQPERNKAPVRTASVHQVRQKVSTGSIGGWRSDEKVFEPFLANLDPELWPGIV